MPSALVWSPGWAPAGQLPIYFRSISSCSHSRHPKPDYKWCGSRSGSRYRPRRFPFPWCQSQYLPSHNASRWKSCRLARVIAAKRSCRLALFVSWLGGHLRVNRPRDPLSTPVGQLHWRWATPAPPSRKSAFYSSSRFPPFFPAIVISAGDESGFRQPVRGLRCRRNRRCHKIRPSRNCRHLRAPIHQDLT